MSCQRITGQEFLTWASYFALKLYVMSENQKTGISKLASYFALKLYVMPENRTTEISNLGLILCFEAVWHARESHDRNF